MAAALSSKQGIFEYRRRTLVRLLTYSFRVFLLITCIRSTMLIFIGHNLLGFIDLAIQINAMVFCRICLLLVKRGRFQLAVNLFLGVFLLTVGLTGLVLEPSIMFSVALLLTVFTVIALVMQHLDNSITTFTKRNRFGIRRYSSKQGHGEPNPSWIPVGNEVTRRIAEKIDGVAGGTWGELFNIPLTAHFLGGAAIGDSADHGVIDPYHRVYHYPTLSVVDGAAISANLGVNPSLSITAQAERAAALWPNKGEQDLRPAQGEAYRRLTPIAPAHPVVPADAPAALRNLPIEPVSSAG